MPSRRKPSIMTWVSSLSRRPGEKRVALGQGRADQSAVGDALGAGWANRVPRIGPEGWISIESLTGGPRWGQAQGLQPLGFFVICSATQIGVGYASA